MSLLSLSQEEFQLISDLVQKKFGIHLGQHKRALIIGRLQKELQTGGFSSFKEYYDYVVKDPTGKALLTLIDRVSTNHTYFFREKNHFEFLVSSALPQIKENLNKKGKKDLRIWCAGCSSGEEPYTLAMILSEHFGDHLTNMDIGILATDISTSALEKAVKGVYPADKMSQVPPLYRQKHFTPLKDGSWVVKQNIKDLVVFRRLNLVGDSYPFKGLFHTILCRNVMIYFDDDTQKSLTKRFHRYMEPEGYLLIGHSESLDRSSGMYKYIKPSIYQKK